MLRIHHNSLCLYLEFAMFHECLVNGIPIANCNLLWEKLIIIPTLLPVQCSVKGYYKGSLHTKQ